MAKSDYFVVVYRILTYLKDCFMSGDNPDIDMIGPDAMKISNGYWTNIIESIYNEGYIRGVYIVPRAGGAPGIKLSNVKITQKGIEFLQDNSTMAKVAEFLKSVKETIPGL